MILSAFTEAGADDFYKGKQIRLVISNVPGGAFDIAARLVAQHMARHIPGNPIIVSQNMQGATGLIASNYIYNIAPKDGTVIAAAHPSLPVRQIFGDENVKYDAAKLQWIGSPQSSPELIAVFHTAPIKTIDEAKIKEVVLGATTVRANSAVVAALSNNLIGTKFRLALGYSGSDVDLAVERGEVHGRAGQNWGGWNSTRPDWVRDKKLIILAQFGLKPDPALPDVPMMTDLVPDTKSRQIMRLFASQNDLGKPLYVVPEVPRDRVLILRRAFNATMNDPTFIAGAKRQKFEVNATSGEELDQIVAEIVAMPEALRAEAEKAMDYR